VAARGNFCSVTSRAASPTGGGTHRHEVNEKLVSLARYRAARRQTFVETVKDYRFVLVLRPTRPDLFANIADTDPQQLGVPPLLPGHRTGFGADRCAGEPWIAAARQILHTIAGQLAQLRALPRPGCQVPQVFGLRAAAIATYPMYRGVARLWHEGASGARRRDRDE